MPQSRLPTVSGNVFYGWVVVGVAFVTNVATTPLNPLIFSLFLSEIIDDTGWARGAVALAFSVRLLASAITTPLLGPLVDRHGSRWLSVIAGLVVLVSLASLTITSSLWALYIAFGAIGAMSFGAPGGSVLTQVPPAKWFVARRGRALAITSVGLSGGTLLTIGVASLLLANFDWRASYAIFGVGIAALVVPLNALFMRRAPEDHGLLPDGASPAAASGPKVLRGASTAPAPFVAADPDRDWPASEALRTGVFWLAVGALLAQGIAGAGTLVHRVDFWEENGVPTALRSAGIATDAGSVVITTLVWGVIAERVPIRVLGIAQGLAFAASMLPLLFLASQPWSPILHSLIWGVGAGAFINLNNLLWPAYFGRTYLGAIRGAVLPATLAAAALGPPLYGVLLDGGIDARMLWTASLVMFALAGILLSLTRPPRRQPTTSSGLPASSSV